MRLEQKFLWWTTAREAMHLGWWMVVSFHFVMDLHLVAAQLALVAVVQSAVALLFEVPAGVFADTVGRKRSVVVSLGLMGAAMIATGFAVNFPVVLATQILWGISWTFMSGADVAWITDDLDEPSLINGLLAQLARWQSFGAAAGLVVLTVLAVVLGRRHAIVIAGVVMLVVGGWVLWAVPEHRFVKRAVAFGQAAVKTLRDGLKVVRADRVIVLLLLVALLVNGADDAFGRIYPARLSNLEFPATTSGMFWFGALNVGVLAATGIGMLLVQKLTTRERDSKRLLLLVCLVGVVGLGVLAGASLLLYGVIGVVIVGGLCTPLGRMTITIWVNQRCAASSRATVHSFLAQAEYVAEIVLGLGIVAVASAYGAAGAMAGAGLMLLAAVVLVAVLPAASDSFNKGAWHG